MTQIRIKRVYDLPETDDGCRVLVDRLWPRGMKKEDLKYDAWEKNIAPSSGLRAWFHDDPQGRWDAFSARYLKELEASDAVRDFLVRIKPYKAITLLYASKDPVRNHARVLQRFLEVSAGKK